MGEGADRNKSCPCGSGKKYKLCCLPREGSKQIRQVPIPPELIDKVEAERERVKMYGHVRPIIHTSFKGQRVVAVGSTILWDSGWKTFTDFLFAYIKQVLGLEWGQAEQEKPIEQRHPIMQWNAAVGRFTKSHPAGQDGICGAIPDGSTQAYVALAYDLYVLKDHVILQESLLRRLKHKDQFQGARYELFVIATCIRANYEIAYEDETDSTVRHNEFVASHCPTGQKIAVEAKSRHRPGVLGRPGHQQSPEELRVGIGRLLRDALEKPASHPRVVFIDVNFPPVEQASGGPPWVPDALDTLNDFLASEGGQSPWNLVILTNHPYHYGPEGVTYPAEQAAAHIPDRPRPPVANQVALTDLIKAVQQFGKIPTLFPDEWGREA